MFTGTARTGAHASASPMPGVEPLAKWLGVAAIFMAISRFHDHFSILSELRAPALASAGALLLLFLKPHRWRPEDLYRHWLTKCVLILFVIAVVGVPFSIYPRKALAFITDEYGRTLLLAVIAWAIARTPAGARLLAKTIAVSGIAAMLSAYFVGRGSAAGRLGGANMYDPNDIALIAVITIPFVLWWAVDDRNRFRLLVLASLPLLVNLVFRTNSRSGGLGLAVVCLGVIIVLRQRHQPLQLRKASRLFLVAAALTLPFIPITFVDRMRSIVSDDDYNRTSLTGRQQIWQRAFGYAVRYPLLGVGIGNFSTAEGTLSTVGVERASLGLGWKWSSVHNSFLQVMAELGFPALFVFVFMIARTVIVLCLKQRSRPPPPELRLLGPMVGIAWLGFAVSGFFLSFAFYDIVYVMIALSSAIMLASTSSEAVANGRPVPAGRRAISRQSIPSAPVMR